MNITVIEHPSYQDLDIEVLEIVLFHIQHGLTSSRYTHSFPYQGIFHKDGIERLCKISVLGDVYHHCTTTANSNDINNEVCDGPHGGGLAHEIRKLIVEANNSVT